MADSKISNLTAVVTPASSDEFAINQGGASKKITTSQIGDAFLVRDNLIFQNANDSVTGFQVLDADGGTPILNIDTVNERVGIGIATPLSALHISGVGNAGIRVNASTGDPTLDFYKSGAFKARVGLGDVTGSSANSLSFRSQDDIAFGTFGTLLRGIILGSAGSWGIGPENNSPTGTLFVYNAIATTGITTQTVKAGAGQSTNDLQVWTDNSDVVLAKVTSETFSLADGGTKPTADAAHRGNFWYEAGGAGVKDTVEICAKDASDVYAWRVIY